jgi:hypothetical protein
MFIHVVRADSSRCVRTIRSTAFAALLIPGTLSGCAASDPSFQSGSTFPLLEYRLPESAIQAKIPLTLVSCGRSLEVEGEFALEAEARASDQAFAITPAELESARVKRGLEVKLHDTGAIASLNSENSDRTGAIVGNIFKFVASLAGTAFGISVPAGASGGVAPSICNDETQDALHRVVDLDRAIAAQRAIKPTTPAAYQSSVRMMERLIEEQQALRSGPLHVDLVGALQLASATLSADRRTYSGDGKLDLGPTSEWLVVKPTPAPQVSLNWAATPAAGSPALFSGAKPAALCAERVASGQASELCFAEPVRISFSAKATFTGITSDGQPLTLDTKKTFPVPQWGSLRVLPVTAAVGSSRTVGLTLDKFGRVTELKWASEARAEALTSMAADIAGRTQAIASANSTVNQNKAEVEALTTLQTLNRLRACREILEQGGSECPAEARVTSEPE